jgi:choline monooxygenase
MIDPRDLEIVPLERSDTIPSSWYTSDEIYQTELRAIFSKSWQFVGSCSQLPERGSQLVTQVGTEPIIVVRGKDDVIRAFYNVCRHRGGPLATEDGCSSMLQCKYHGWTYTLEGQLRGVPDFDRVELFDKKDFGLVPVALAEWEGLLFVALEPPEVTLEQLFAGIRGRNHSTNIPGLHFYKRVTYEVACNWKIYVDNYLEGYHVPIVHPELFKIYDFRKYITETRDWYSFQHSPLDESENLYSKRARNGAAEALYFFVYPNFMLNIMPGRLQTNLVQPIASNKCRVVFDYYYEDITSSDSLELIAKDLAFSDSVQEEDIEICELVQRGVSSRSYDRGRFSVKRENAVYHFQCLLKQAFRDA